MSKRENDFYYSFTSPAKANSSGGPSESIHNTEVRPPSYDEAVLPSSSATEPAPPPNKLNYQGYVLDSTVPPFNPYVQPMPMPQPSVTNDYAPYQDQPAEAPLLGAADSLTQEYEDFAGRPSPPGYSLHQARYKTVKEGVISRDKHINQDGEALVQFLYQHNTRPRLMIHFYGYHEETEWNTVSTRDSNGELVQERQPTTRRIDDFNFDVDVSEEVSNVCQGVYILPDPKTAEVKTLRDLCNDYVHDQNILKELKLTKEVNWDFNGLTRALTAAIRNSGFYENIEISFRMENNEIVVKTDHKVSRWIDNKYLRFFLFITCLWILTWPVIWMCRKTFGHKTLKSAWRMNVSEREWYGLHAQEVINSCRGTNIFFRTNNAQPSNFHFNGLFR